MYKPSGLKSTKVTYLVYASSEGSDGETRPSLPFSTMDAPKSYLLARKLSGLTNFPAVSNFVVWHSFICLQKHTFEAYI